MGQAPPKRPSPRVPEEGVLVRRPTVDKWLSTLPTTAGEPRVTVSMTDATAAIRHAAELAARGYHPVGVAGVDDGGPGWADFFVPRQLAAADPQWLRRLCGPDGRLLEPAFGPVRALLAGVLAAHAR